MLTPLDIQNKEFSRGLRGYREDDVDEFLDQIMISYEKLYKENSELKEKIEKIHVEIDKYKNIEETLKNTLIVAQTSAEEVKNNAIKKSELIIEEAELRAKQIIEKSNKEVDKVNQEFESMKKEMQIFKTRFKTLLESQLESVLNGFEEVEK
ncbi:DivIVA domain-containing protein [Serpentinicella sp. ANB-PHB4]|uniref:DivIVA domain-containing protein n=1 Tax=Serpentinicella sp. ANB-PHB4 TaxID=3074076 RepID=UPI00285B59C3|nr:DivIVA domain-containing protein [Serpentinicella sp. ANB-PHB4]MDR5657925.1 DivIVA domain-containing protein [Serpentinicella sp. ANB-PHB4]